MQAAHFKRGRGGHCAENHGARETRLKKVRGARHAITK
jgi:hypothetical protein